jgi:hypothetical protein
MTKMGHRNPKTMAMTPIPMIAFAPADIPDATCGVLVKVGVEDGPSVAATRNEDFVEGETFHPSIAIAFMAVAELMDIVVDVHVESPSCAVYVIVCPADSGDWQIPVTRPGCPPLRSYPLQDFVSPASWKPDDQLTMDST